MQLKYSGNSIPATRIWVGSGLTEYWNASANRRDPYSFQEEDDGIDHAGIKTLILDADSSKISRRCMIPPHR